MSGRQSLIQLSDAKIAEQFRKLAQDVKAGRLPIQVATEAVSATIGKPLSVKSFRRAIKALEQQDRAAQTYAQIDTWKRLPGIGEFAAWLQNQRGGSPTKDHKVTEILTILEKLWLEVLEKKNLSLLSEQDMGNIMTWINGREVSIATKYGYVMCVRYLISYGYGNHAWLKRYLGTKRFKAPARIPPELKSKETFHTVMPRLFQALDKLVSDGKVLIGKAKTVHLVEHLKSTTGARTGHREEQREVWGTIINNARNDRTSLLLDQNGRVLHWTLFAKGSEVWEIPREAFETYPGLLEELEEYIRERGLKTGDYLVNDLSVPEARKILTEQCKLAGLSHYTLHDLRKIAATRSIQAGVPLEVTAEMGVGWKDIPTLVKYYVTIKGATAEQGYAMVKAYLNNGGREAR